VLLNEVQIQYILEALEVNIEACEDGEREDPGSTSLPEWEELHRLFASIPMETP
jgi:hypothetical protein